MTVDLRTLTRGHCHRVPRGRAGSGWTVASRRATTAPQDGRIAMSKSSKKHPARDARFKHRYPVVWYGTRVETHRHVADGEGYMRPDLCAWLEGTVVRASRRVPPDAPDTVMVELLDEAITHTTGSPGMRAPTELHVVDAAMRDALKDALAGRLPVRAAPDERAEETAERLAGEQGYDEDDPPLPMLSGGAVAAPAVEAVVARLRALYEAVDWAALRPFALEFVLRAPEVALPDASVWVHGQEPMVTIARTLADRTGRVRYERGGRARETRWLAVGFKIPSDDEGPCVAEAEARGWCLEGTPRRIPFVRAQDVENVPRPLSRADLGLVSAAAVALIEWFRRNGTARDVPEGGASLEVELPPEVTGVAGAVRATLELTGSSFDDSSQGEDALSSWIHAALPVPGPLPVSEEEVEEARRMFLTPGDAPLSEAARQAVARGVGMVPALVHLLSANAAWEGTSDTRWPIPWILAALAQIGDSRAVPYVLRAVAEHTEDLGDFLTEDLCVVLAAFGPAAFDPLEAVLRGSPLDEYLRSASARALYLIAVEHPEMRPRLQRALVEFYGSLTGDDPTDAFLASSLASMAARTHDERVDAAVRAAFDVGIYESFTESPGDYEAMRREPAWSREDSPDERSLDEVLRNPWWDESR